MSTKGKGTTVSWDATDVGELTGVRSMSGPVGEIPIGSFADSVYMTAAGDVDLGDFIFTINFNPDDAGLVKLYTDWASGTARTIVLLAPSGTTDTVTMTGKVLYISAGAQKGGIHTGEVALCLTAYAES